MAPFSAAILVAGFAYASYTDVRTREVPDFLWLFLALAGLALGIPAYLGLGTIPLLLWLVAGLLVVEHLVPWDAPVERIRSWLPGALELAFYIATVLVFVIAAHVGGIATSPSGVAPGAVPIPAIAVVVGVFLARGLFEVGILYGGADAKALMVAGVLIPIDGIPLLASPAPATALLAYYPFALNVLMDAALLSIGIPLSLLVTNLARGEFEFPRGFLGYRIPVRELPDRFVWLKDPLLAREDEAAEAESSEEDREIRQRQRDELLAKGVERVWVTPQLPFVVLLFGGVVLALLWGNVVFDLAALV